MVDPLSRRPDFCLVLSSACSRAMGAAHRAGQIAPDPVENPGWQELIPRYARDPYLTAQKCTAEGSQQTVKDCCKSKGN